MLLESTLYKYDQNQYQLTRCLFIRLLALIYLAAFASLSSQILALAGADGILPFKERLQNLTNLYGNLKYWRYPNLFWLNSSDLALSVSTYAGIVSSIFIFFNVWTRPCLIVNYLLYLSLCKAGQTFTLFQWDFFLLEIGFLAIFLSYGSKIICLLYQFLLARFMLMGGIVKLASGDSSWWDLTALNYHYLTQPLPTPLAYYAHFLPEWINQSSVLIMLLIELIAPILVFIPGKSRKIAFYSIVILQISIILTGNYNFFNLLTILLCLFLLNDQILKQYLPQIILKILSQQDTIVTNPANKIACSWLVITLLLSILSIWHQALRQPLPDTLTELLRSSHAFALYNNYGPFAVMTKKRNEIIIQGSLDGITWKNYAFHYKPGKLDRPLTWLIPHQPRLDWQMWFAAISPRYARGWLQNMLAKLLHNSTTVLSLFEKNPFTDQPPRYIRAQLYEYQYTTPAQRNKTGEIWKRTWIQPYGKTLTPGKNNTDHALMSI